MGKYCEFFGCMRSSSHTGLVLTALNWGLIVSHFTLRGVLQATKPYGPATMAPLAGASDSTSAEPWTQWLFFLGHFFMAVVFQCYVAERCPWANNKCCQLLHLPYRMPLKQIDAGKYLDRFDRSSRLQMVQKHSQEYERVEKLVLGTWHYENRKGRDSRGLGHDRIEITSIFRITEPPKSKAFCSIPADVALPKEILKKPVATSLIASRLSATETANFEAPFQKTFGNENREIKYESVTEDDCRTTVPCLGSQDACLGTAEKSLNTDNSASHSLSETISKETSRKETDHPESINVGEHIDGSISGCNETSIDCEPVSETDELLSQNSQPQSEWILFHGTPINNILSIVRGGFDLGKAHRGLYGKGLYLAESSEKADQYADPAGMRRSTTLTMLLVRVKPGNVKCQYPDIPNDPATGSACFCCGGKEPKDTVVAGLDKRFREFIFHEMARCIPEYVIVYNRTKNTQSVEP